MRNIILGLALWSALIIATPMPGFAQDTPWRMPGTQLVNPKRETPDDRLVWKPVKWAFPADGQVSLELEGKTFYQLGPEVFGKRGNFKKGMETAVIIFSPKLAALASMIHIQEPDTVPDIDQFLAAVAVMRAVETPDGYTNQYLGNGRVDGLLVYFYRTRSGANVGAHVGSDRRRVLVMPAPSEP